MRGLVKAFDRKVAVDRLSLDIPVSSFYGIVGPVGAPDGGLNGGPPDQPWAARTIATGMTADRASRKTRKRATWKEAYNLEEIHACVQGEKIRNELTEGDEMADEADARAHGNSDPQRILQHALAPLLAAPRHVISCTNGLRRGCLRAWAAQ